MGGGATEHRLEGNLHPVQLYYSRMLAPAPGHVLYDTVPGYDMFSSLIFVVIVVIVVLFASRRFVTSS